MQLTVQGSEDMTLAIEPTALVIAGWTGRDPAVLQEHIDELAAIGIAPPKAVPMFYRVGTELLTSGARIQQAGQDATGEVEAVLWKMEDRLYVGIGSDHTDRVVEASGITISKQVCPKPVSKVVWPWQEVAEHWDRLTLRSQVDGEAIYQEGATAGLRRPDELLALYAKRMGGLPESMAMFCGTLPVRGGIRFAASWTLTLEDPVRGRSIEHVYSVDCLPIAED